MIKKKIRLITMKNQQRQTLKHFEKNAKSWFKQSLNKDKKNFNTIQQRNEYVLQFLKKNKKLSFLDIGCGPGNLVGSSSKFTKKSIGIDFSKEMIDIAKKNFSNKKTFFYCSSIFNFDNLEKFDVISANGFIEYISINDLKNFLIIVRKKLNRGGHLIFSSRNRLYNLFSLNDFTKTEISKGSINHIINESILLNNLDIKKFIKIKTNLPISERKQPLTSSIKVNVRNQFTPLQLISLLKKFNFKTLDLKSINYHPVTPNIFNKNKKKISVVSNSLNNQYENLSLIPCSSTFMVIAKCT